MTPVKKIIAHLKKYDWPITMAEETSWTTLEKEYLKSAYTAGYMDNQAKIYDPNYFIDSLNEEDN